MCKFDHEDFNHLKKLCRIDCSPEEEQDILNSLQRVLGYIEQLDEINTEGVKACNYVLQSMLKNQMREDVVKDLLPREKFLNNAPDQIGGMVRVPPVLKG
jgi:aspartyl-tRNA(Asn)/glutamyl-tRNA(Gln) amidotransferase subunit C